MTDFKTLQDAHLRLLTRQDAEPNDPGLVADAQAYIAEVIGNSTWIADPGERDLLRAYLRYWAGVIYERTGTYPKTELRPAEIAAAGAGAATTTPGPAPQSQPTATPPPARGGLPSWARLLAGLLVLLAVAALALLFFNRMMFSLPPGETANPSIPEPATPLPPVTRTLAPEAPGPATPIDQSNAAALQPLARADAHTGGALAVMFDTDRPEIATAGADGDVRFWAWVAPDNLTLARQLTVGGGPLNTVDYSPPGSDRSLPSLVLTGGNNRIISVYTAESLQLFAEFVPSSRESGFVFAGRFSPDGALMASGHADGITRIWNVSTGTESGNVVSGGPGQSRLAQIPSGGAVRDVAFSPDGLYLAQAVTGELGLQVVDRSWSNVVCAARSGPATAVAYSPRGDRLAAGTADGRLLLVAQTPNGCQGLAEVAAHDGGVAGVAFSPTGDWLVTVGASADGAGGWMKLFTPDGAELARLDIGAAPTAVAVAPDATAIATVDLNGRLILWGIP